MLNFFVVHTGHKVAGKNDNVRIEIRNTPEAAHQVVVIYIFPDVQVAYMYQFLTSPVIRQVRQRHVILGNTKVLGADFTGVEHNSGTGDHGKTRGTR